MTVTLRVGHPSWTITHQSGARQRPGRSPDADIAVMTLSVARTVGQMCADSGHADIVDIHVALCAREREHAVVTSDADDLARIDPALPLIRV